MSVEERGVVLLCDHDGTVQKVIRDDFGLDDRAHAGSHLHDLMDEGMRNEIGLFLTELQARKAVFEREIAVPVNGILTPLHFAGACLESGYVIVAASSHQGLDQLHEELMRINNDQTNVLRSTAKDRAVAQGIQSRRDDALYEELTTLNNEMANLQRELAKKNVELEKVNEQKNRLMGMAAHDLRSPLGVILSYAEILETEASAVLSENQRELVTTIKETSDFMLRMVTDLLDVSVMESGRLNLDRRPADLVRLIQRNVMLNRLRGSKKEIAVEFDPPAVFPTFEFDVDKMEQVLNNLIGNAVKFSHRNTRVRILLTCNRAEVTVAVEDQGQGIPSAEFSKLFLPYSKISVRSTAGEPSTGLGLAIVRRIVEGHGGRIDVASEVGTGTTFTFTLPLTLGLRRNWRDPRNHVTPSKLLWIRRPSRGSNTCRRGPSHFWDAHCASWLSKITR